ncbi:MAG TPA: J domain-containing protein [Myxococcaceae bacterium]|jgi:hypothetical protein|nr:J domain-containing protein [Myxococcaceae bacterium]HZA51489.1 J domain-containing protein [Myxococcaceae bacterium]
MPVAGADLLGDVEVECTRCGIRMTAHLGSGQRVRYFQCSGCHRWVSSVYAEVFRANAQIRTRPAAAPVEPDASFDRVKERLERWLSAIEDQDPYRVLGVSPLASPGEVKERYRELAFRTHPDRGGNAERMRELNLAYERVLDHQTGRRLRALENGSRGDERTPGRVPQGLRETV